MNNTNRELMIGCEALEGWEGYRATTYLDSENIETIGIGRNLEVFPMEHDELESDGTYSHVNAVAWAYDQMAACRKRLVYRFPWVVEHPPEIRILLTDMVYNLGLNGLSKFTHTLSCIKKGNYSQAAMELQDSKYFRQTGQRALAHYRTLVALSVA